MRGIDETLQWLDVVVACTSDGPIMLALSCADLVTDEKAHREISKHIMTHLGACQHPALNRLRMNGDLAFYPLDNTNGLAGKVEV